MDLAGKNVLVVEDSPLIAASVQEMLSDLGCEVIGPAGNMADAYELCQNANLDVALIDLNIRGSKSFRLLKACPTGRYLSFLPPDMPTGRCQRNGHTPLGCKSPTL